VTGEVQPFRIAIPQADLDDVRERLRRTRWPREVGDNSDWRAGTSLAYLKGVVRHWIEDYDWRAHERAMNAFPNFRTEIDGVPIHFIHVKGKGPNPRPLIINHGWPWTFWDMRRMIGPLSDPAAHGGDPADAFDVVCPSLPGFAFSSPVDVPGLNLSHTADLWVKLMARLGYDRFATQGGDMGAMVSTYLGHRHADRVLGVHLHLLLPIKEPMMAPEDFADDEKPWMAQNAQFMMEGSGYMQIQRTRPQTIAVAMNDSPAGLASWLIDKRHAWSDIGEGDAADIESVYSKDDLITTCMLYWLTETYVSAARHYYDMKIRNVAPTHDTLPVVPVPTGVLQFEKDVLLGPRKWAERYFNLKRWNVEKRGGHFAPFEKPQVMVEDIRAFFRDLR
jgi:pimeloyl-ACP methyl ester carboxylesterase